MMYYIHIIATPSQVLWQKVKTHNAAFHQDLHCSERQKNDFKIKKIIFLFEKSNL